jgi:glycosyltransferase involved in cell wall biosynthesis
VAHELASAWHAKGAQIHTISLKSYAPSAEDPSLPVHYLRSSLPSFNISRQLLLPLPSRRLWAVLSCSDQLYAHLPCPGLFLVVLLARVLQPRRIIRLHWHAFLECPLGLKGWLIALYEWFALRLATFAVQGVVTTSPMLAAVLVREGVKPQKVSVLPCCIGEIQERLYGQIAIKRRNKLARAQLKSLQLLFIGRLDSYKRVDWLIEACAANRALRLHVAGDGPHRQKLQRMVQVEGLNQAVLFHGRISELDKLALLNDSDLLVLSSDSSNEAFGIVQLEAMACGLPALAFDHPRSGMAWVSQLNRILNVQSVKSEDLLTVIDKLLGDPLLLEEASAAAEQRYQQVFSRPIWNAAFSDLVG